MRKYILVFFLGLLTYPLVTDIIGVAEYHTESVVLTEIYWKVNLPTYGIQNILNGNCTKDISMNGHGWVFINREYFQCNKVQIKLSDLIFGEYSHPINPELEKKLKEKQRGTYK